MRRIYLDDAAATQTRPKVLKAMIPYFTAEYGNPSSPHEMGEKARKAIDNARKIIADKLGAKPWEIIFTSGSTESNNLAFQGLSRNKKGKIIISAIEHASITETCNFLKSKGYEIKIIPVDKDGFLRLDELEREIDNKTLLVSVMHANNVIGTIQDLKKIREICKKKNVLFHTDASQSFCKENIDIKNVDLLSASAHKIGGPKGIGFLYVKEGIEISPLIFGGGQERGLRGGTENVPAIIGFAKAVENAKSAKLGKLRNYFINQLEKIGKINGSIESRLDNNIHVSFNCNAEMLVLALSRKGIYVSTGSACETKNKKENVLKAIGLSDKEAKGSIRITLNETITKKDVDFVVKEIKKLVK